jgi:15-cis-phytoene desaturase
LAKRVVVLGAGVGGLTAAHELAERGYDVTVYERMNAFGGKARSIPKPNSGIEQRQDLPGEHGFRFFPGFYRHVVDTMQRIPFHKTGNVGQNLVAATLSMLARFDQSPLVALVGFPRSGAEWKAWFKEIGQMISGANGVSLRDNLHFARCLWVMASSCMERVDKEYDWIPYWRFIDAEHRSLAYQQLLGEGLTRSLVAMKAELSSTRTIATVFCQMIYPMLDPTRHDDRLLCAPTDIAWIFPWVSYLMRLGVKYQLGKLVYSFEAYEDAPRLQNITIDARGEKTVLTHGQDFDYAISAIPVDGMTTILSFAAGKAFLAKAPGLAGLTQLETRWMNGIQFYLEEDVPIVNGHILYASTPWALTAISQVQFWKQFELTTSGDGCKRGLLSVDISEWSEPGILIQKPACKCTHEEIATEVWAQLKRSHNVNGQQVLPEQVPEYFMDDCISLEHVDPYAKSQLAGHKNPYGDHVSLEPLFINTVGSHRLRPKADFGFDNFFVASDYVRTYTDLATMEGANEAARRAVNALLERDGSSAPRARVWPLEQPWYVRPWQWLDAWRYSRGKPNLFSSPEMRLQPGDKDRPTEPPRPHPAETVPPDVQAKGTGV